MVVVFSLPGHQLGFVNLLTRLKSNLILGEDNQFVLKKQPFDKKFVFFYFNLPKIFLSLQYELIWTMYPI